MDFEFKISLKKNEYNDFKLDNINFLKRVPNNTIEDLKSYIFDKLDNKDGSPEITELKTANFKYDVDKGAGSFRLTFLVSRRFCCSDVSSSNQDYIDFTFQLENSYLTGRASYFDWTLNN